MSLDGFIAGPNGAMDWMTWNWDDALKNFVTELTDSVGTIVLGRNLAEGFIPHWAGVAADAENPMQEAGKKFSETPKVVFSRTLTESKWENVAVAGDLASEITRLKGDAGGDVIAYGGGAFVASLIQANLIDEYFLFVNPAAIGSGMPIFNTLNGTMRLSLKTATAFDCGIVVLHYAPAQPLL